MSDDRPMSKATDQQAGFTLLESLVAMAILSVVVIHFLGVRTSAMIDATEARNWRLARELGEWKLSEVRAGANEFPPEDRRLLDFEDYEGFSYQVLIGESSISEVDSEIAGLGDSDDDGSGEDRHQWQRERDDVRQAQSQGLSLYDYQEQQRVQEQEDIPPSESEIEEVAIVVYFPDVRGDEEGAQAHLMLKAKVSTMAIAGLTPEEAQERASSQGQEYSRSNRPPGAPNRNSNNQGGN